MSQKHLNEYLNRLAGWKSKSRIYGEACEMWVQDSIPCPKCSSALTKCETNKKSVDHICSGCGEKYQVKSSSKGFQKRDKSYRIMGAEYKTTLSKISTWNILLVKYSEHNGCIENVLYIDRKNIFNKNVTPRKPLGPNARRAGWQGCYLDFKDEVVKELWGE